LTVTTTWPDETWRPSPNVIASAIKATFTPEWMTRFRVILGSDDAVAKFIQNLINVCNDNQYLLELDRTSLCVAAVNAAIVGLSLEKNLGHAYLIPREGKVCYQVGYRGLMHLAYMSDRVASFTAGIVTAGDEFEFEYGTTPFLRHKPKFKKDAQVTYVWALCNLKSGPPVFHVMTFEEIEERRRMNMAEKKGKFSPWQAVGGWEAMAKSKPIRIICKMLQLSPALDQAISIEEAQEAEWKAEERKLSAGETLTQRLANVPDNLTLDAELKKRFDKEWGAGDEQVPLG
jgi:recombination protein RecT